MLTSDLYAVTERELQINHQKKNENKNFERHRIG